MGVVWDRNTVNLKFNFSNLVSYGKNNPVTKRLILTWHNSKIVLPAWFTVVCDNNPSWRPDPGWRLTRIRVNRIHFGSLSISDSEEAERVCCHSVYKQ